MRALVLSEGYELLVDNVPIPVIKDNEVLIKIKSVGICGSDVHGFKGTTGRRIPPVIMGHELSGVIEKKGKHSLFKIGDRVAVNSTIYCGQCSECNLGHFSICSNRKVIGVSCSEYSRDGGMAEYISLPDHIVYELPDNVSYDEAALLEPCSVALHAVSKINVSKNKQILVFGAGTIGLLITHMLKMKGYENIYIVDKIKSRLDIALRMGATKKVLWDKSMLNEYSVQLEHPTLIDCIIDAVGTSDSLNAGIKMINRRGLIRLVGNTMGRVDFPLQDVVTKEIILKGSYAFNDEMAECISFMEQKKIDVKPLISKIIDLEEAPYWFKRLSEKDTEIVKVIIRL
jgi:L-iditol 2-dehydrogenase